MRDWNSGLASSRSDATLNAEVRLLLEEYRTLRAEVIAAIQSQHQALGYGIAALALFLVAVAQIWKGSPLVASFALIVLIPGGIFFVVAVWGTEVTRMTRVGFYIGQYLEKEINRASNLEVQLNWDSWLLGPSGNNPSKEHQAGPNLRTWWRLKTPKEHRLRWNYTCILLILAFLTIASFAIGFGRLVQHEHWGPARAISAFAVMATVFLGFPFAIAIRTFRDAQRKYERLPSSAFPDNDQPRNPGQRGE